MDAFTTVGARLWIGDDTHSFSLRQAAGSATLTPTAETSSFNPLDTGATRRIVTQRSAAMAFESLYWRPSSDDLFTWLEGAGEIKCLYQLANGAAWMVAGPRESFSVSAPTGDLVQIAGNVENGRGPIAYVGNVVLSGEKLTATQLAALSSDFGAAAQPYGFVNFDWLGGHPLYAVAVVDRVVIDGTAVVPTLKVRADNLNDGNGAVAAVERTVFAGATASGTRLGAGIQSVELTSSPLAETNDRRGTLEGGTPQNVDSADIRIMVMQELGAVDK